ncbi:MAG: response regulator transcription factor [Chloroflexi bacterium]|nr:response regulator transcription factor [Chloroflexota bacterium]
MKILLADDDPDILDVTSHALTRAGYHVETASSGEQALGRAVSWKPDLTVLDVNLPGIDGFEVCRRIRLESQAPIVMLTACDDEDDIMRGFRLGADDYITKPFSVRQLLARIAAVLRRTTEANQRRRTERLDVGRLSLDTTSLEVCKDGQPVHLTPLEFRILHILAANEGRVVPYSRLIEYAWGNDGGSPTHLKIRICNIRKKLGLPIDGEAGIRAVVGTGYTLRSL